MIFVYSDYVGVGMFELFDGQCWLVSWCYMLGCNIDVLCLVDVFDVQCNVLVIGVQVVQFDVEVCFICKVFFLFGEDNCL